MRSHKTHFSIRPKRSKRSILLRMWTVWTIQIMRIINSSDCGSNETVDRTVQVCKFRPSSGCEQMRWWKEYMNGWCKSICFYFCYDAWNGAENGRVALYFQWNFKHLVHLDFSKVYIIILDLVSVPNQRKFRQKSTYLNFNKSTLTESGQLSMKNHQQRRGNVDTDEEQHIRIDVSHTQNGLWEAKRWNEVEKQSHRRVFVKKIKLNFHVWWK